MKNKIIYLLILLICCSFIGSTFNPSFNSQVSDKDKAALKIIHKTGKTLEKKYNLNPCGFGMSGIDKFSSLRIEFQIKRILSKEEGQKILIECMHELLENINSNEEIRRFLINYPFTNKDIGITFYITDSTGHDLSHPDLTVIDCSDGEIIYRTKNPDKKFGYKESYKENLEDVLRTIDSDSNVLNSNIKK